MSVSRRAVEAHSLAQARGIDHYIDPDSGLLVMTATYLRNRGYCCENSCRHCPWGLEEGTDTPVS